MKTKLLLCALLFVLSININAQSSATFFTENGEKFYVLVDNVKSNTEPKLNVFVDNLTKKDYNIKILLEDGNSPIIDATLRFRDDYDKYIELSYSICKDKKGCYQLTKNISKETKKIERNNDIIEGLNMLADELNKMEEEKNKPDCEKLKYGIIHISNQSYNPYQIFVNDKYVGDVKGKSSSRLKVKIGITNIKAKQSTGYAFSPTINLRTVKIEKACEEKITKVGFED